MTRPQTMQSQKQLSAAQLSPRQISTASRRILLAGVLAGLTGFTGIGAGGGFAPPAALAQNLFAPQLYVNDQVITAFEVDQRALFMKVLNAPGDLEKEALKSLIDDRLRLSEAKRLGVKLSPEELTAGMEEFASRASLSADQLIAELQKVGISAETYRDFVQAGALWRKIVRERYSGMVPVSEAEVDLFLEASLRPRALKVLVSELVIPAEPGQEAEAMDLAKSLAGSIKSEGAFAAAAREYSAAPTAEGGGRIPDWLPLANLPPVISGQLLALGQGAVSAPVTVPGAVVLFQLRGVETDSSAAPAAMTVEWADLTIPDDPALYAKILAGADTCNDLYALANVPAEQLTLRKQSMGEIPSDTGLKLARLDQGEFATLSRGNGAMRLAMLCKRVPVMEKEPDRSRIKEQLMNQKLDGMAENDLEKMRHAALIREP
ncbi:peptidylprolyl isomerase [Pseudogemmobacter faecipullorum]|uniref:Parvulin-like PPIase n=1 Tax=Pseudogemmobacter faecipullorum TaxID=2755041 RepID=A0ABS8CL13_9RHOB|nr:peptidylprolyl isomerase [Pseudogemmobacter faecipullorum]MCB5410089.1 peptidylprolyl isomerase [Pseudogemmobacter faecipullorum]